MTIRSLLPSWNLATGRDQALGKIWRESQKMLTGFTTPGGPSEEIEQRQALDPNESLLRRLQGNELQVEAGDRFRVIEVLHV